MRNNFGIFEQCATIKCVEKYAKSVRKYAREGRRDIIHVKKTLGDSRNKGDVVG